MKTIAMCALLAALAFGLLPGNRDEAAAPDEGLVLLVETQQDAQAPQKASSARQNQSEKAAVQTAPDAQTVRLLDGGAVTALSMEDYLTGVLLSEMPADFETEARKAQAVAARTFTCRKLLQPKHENADVCAEASCCQAWTSREQLRQKYGASFDAVWSAAREAVRAVNPAAIWLAETVHQSFGCLARYRGVRSELDYDMYEAFDLEYEYDIREAFDKYLQGKIVLSHYLDMLNFQEAIYPANYNKLRFLENHDQPRICSYVKDEAALQNYTAMLYFLKGTTLLYAGQENQNETRPDLFNKDVINLDGSRDISDMLRQLYQIKKLPVVAKSSYRLSADEGLGAAIGEHKEIQGKGRLLGIFSFEGKCGQVEAGIQDGTYTNMVNGKEIRIEDGKIDLKMCPVIIKENGE